VQDQWQLAQLQQEREQQQLLLEQQHQSTSPRPKIPRPTEDESGVEAYPLIEGMISKVGESVV
jgi:hypothetical protein